MREKILFRFSPPLPAVIISVYNHNTGNENHSLQDLWFGSTPSNRSKLTKHYKL